MARSSTHHWVETAVWEFRDISGNCISSKVFYGMQDRIKSGDLFREFLNTANAALAKGMRPADLKSVCFRHTHPPEQEAGMVSYNSRFSEGDRLAAKWFRDWLDEDRRLRHLSLEFQVIYAKNDEFNGRDSSLRKKSFILSGQAKF